MTKKDDVVAPLPCNAPGPGLAPDPAIGCLLAIGHDGRHEWSGKTPAGQQSMAWGSSGPSPAGCGALPLLLADGDELPGFTCTREPDHPGGHGWAGQTVKGVAASVDWMGGQMIVLVGDDAAALASLAVDGGAKAAEAVANNGHGEGAVPPRGPAAPRRARPAKKAAKKTTAAKKAAASKGAP